MTQEVVRRFPFEKERKLTEIEVAEEMLMNKVATRIDGHNWLTFEGIRVDQPLRPLVIYEWAWDRTNTNMFVFEIQGHKNLLLVSNVGGGDWRAEKVGVDREDDQINCFAKLPMPNMAGEMEYRPLGWNKGWQEPSWALKHDVIWRVTAPQLSIDHDVDWGVGMGKWVMTDTKDWNKFCQSFVEKVNRMFGELVPKIL